MDRQPASTLNTSDNQEQSLPPQKDSYHVDPIDQIRNDPVTNSERTRQVIIGVDALSNIPELPNNIHQKMNDNALCQCSKSHKAYIVGQSNHLVNCSQVLMILKPSTSYVITQHTYQWYKINSNEILQDETSQKSDV